MYAQGDYLCLFNGLRGYGCSGFYLPEGRWLLRGISDIKSPMDHGNIYIQAAFEKLVNFHIGFIQTSSIICVKIRGTTVEQLSKGFIPEMTRVITTVWKFKKDPSCFLRYVRSQIKNDVSAVVHKAGDKICFEPQDMCEASPKHFSTYFSQPFDVQYAAI